MTDTSVRAPVFVDSSTSVYRLRHETRGATPDLLGTFRIAERNAGVSDERARLLRELADWSTDPDTFAEPLDDPWVERDDAK